jgi:uncharacterized membrane protein
MAGIGFELRKLMANGSYSGLLKAYGYAGLISSGPWVLSILGVFAVGLFRTGSAGSGVAVQQFQISVTYLMVFSFILTSPFQLAFGRFVGDRVFENKEGEVFSNLIGLLTLIFFVGGITGALILVLLFDGPLVYRLGMLSGLVVMSGVWMVMSVLSAVRDYMKVLLGFLIGYGVSVVAAFFLRGLDLEGLLGGYVIGQAVLFFFLLALVLRRFLGKELIAFSFLWRSRFYPKLALTGILFALGMWVDKFIFWFNPLTSSSVIAPLRVSEIYDLPIFLAYLCIIPGMASFVLRMETDFAEKHEAFYASLDERASLDTIMELRDEMPLAIRRGLNEIFKIQGVAVIILLANGENLLEWAGISPLYHILFNVFVVAVSIQVVLLALFNVFSYLNMQAVMVWLGMVFVASNTAFTLLTQYLGPSYYGYGFAASMIVTSVMGLLVLSRSLDRLLYRTYMLQKAKL